MRKTSVRPADNPAQIRTEHLPNTNLERSLQTNTFVIIIIIIIILNKELNWITIIGSSSINSIPDYKLFLY
jgi:hypothetical protein